MASFSMPTVQDNLTGWGPEADGAPDHLRHLPYAPFNKSDRLGRACEWGNTRERDRRWQNKNKAAEEISPFIVEQVDEEGFHLVDTKTAAKPKWGPRRGGMGGRGGGRGGGPGRWNEERSRDGQSASQKSGGWGNERNVGAGPGAQPQRSRFGGRGGRGGGRGFDNWRDKPARVRVSSVEIKPEWTRMDGESGGNEDFTMSLAQMEKLREEDEPTAEEMAMTGSLFLVDKAVDKASVRSSIPMKKMQEARPFYLASSEDPVIAKIAGGCKPGSIFTTDLALGALMAAPRCINSWDMIVVRKGGHMYLDVREGSSLFDTTVNETAVDAPDDEGKGENLMNSQSSLSAEAGYINYNFQQMCLNKTQPPVNVGSGDETLQKSAAQCPAGKAFRYRKFELENEITLVVRCEVDAALKTRDDSLAYITVKSLNEFDSKVSGIDWRQKLESQRAAVLANELKNNRNKLARWTCQALLAGADYIKIGFVSRHHPKDNQSHFVLGQQLYKPEEFARQIELKTDNAWGIASTVLARLQQLPDVADAQYLMVKDPNKPTVNVFKIPLDAFNEVDEDIEDVNEGRDEDHDSDFDA